MRHLRF